MSMIIVTFTSFEAARTKMDEWNALANVPSGGELSSIYVNSTGDGWAINGTDCINNGGENKDKIASEVEELPNFSVETYKEFFELGYTFAVIII